jgi:hypothetical protein
MSGTTIVQAVHTDTGQVVGHLRWGGHGVVENVQVNKDHQRKGVATGMWRHANELADQGLVPRPKHSDVRTAEGDAWAKTVGGELPQNHRIWSK